MHRSKSLKQLGLNYVPSTSGVAMAECSSKGIFNISMGDWIMNEGEVKRAILDNKDVIVFVQV